MGEKQQQNQTSLDIFKKFYLQTAKGDEDRYDTVNLWELTVTAQLYILKHTYVNSSQLQDQFQQTGRTSTDLKTAGYRKV